MTNFDKLREKLAEMFQLDRADLDFGIYRIMNSKRDEILAFLDKDLLPQVKQVLQQAQGEHAIYDRSELEEAEAQARSLGLDPDTVPKVVALREKSKSGLDMFAMEEEVFNHLYSFFRRYYSEGDFLSLRRYKEGVYAIPYEGEEVKLHWANADQYYIKTAENFRDYAFKVGDGKRVHFRLVDAQTERDNNKAQEKRFFILVEQDPVAEIDGELQIRFEYRQPTAKTSQADLTAEAEAVVLTCATAEWAKLLQEKAPTEKSPNRTVLAKHLSDYTARNTFDYFIHKDLGKFLRRELDFYIKNEVMHLDDIENESAPRVEQYLTKIRAIRRVAEKLITFLAQLEDFQKRLWLKKKFVVDTQYLVTLDRVPEDLYPMIIANDAQREEWVRLFCIDGIKQDTTTPSYSIPLTMEFIAANESLLVDTSFFDARFKAEVLAKQQDLVQSTSGTLVHADNTQALRFAKSSLYRKCDVLYADPPYNTDASSIMYKNGYKSSSWLSSMDGAFREATPLLSNGGVMCVAIDDEQVTELRYLLDGLLPARLGIAVVRSNPQSRKMTGKLSPTHEYALFYGASKESAVGSLETTAQKLKRYPLTDSKGRFSWMSFIRTGTNDLRTDRPTMYYPIAVKQDNTMRIPKLKWCAESSEYTVEDAVQDDEVLVYPIVKNGTTTIEKRWHRGQQRVIDEPEEFRIRREKTGGISVDFKTRIDDESAPITWWDSNDYASSNHGAAVLKALFGSKQFDFPKSLQLVKDCLKACAVSTDSIVVDFFAGSGTTGQAVIALNREDVGKRRYILIDSGDYFTTILKPRMLKAAYASEWKEGRPTTRDSSGQQLIKVIVLESYEDTLANLQISKRSPAQQQLLEEDEALREDYLLRYVLDAETAGSQSTLNIQQFAHPFEYKLKVATESIGETKEVNVDLVETFNWLLGLRVKTMDTIRGFQILDGTNPADERVLIIWRDLVENPNEKLDEFFRKQAYNTLDQVYDVIYVNGDNNLQNLRKEDQTWKVRLIEEEFHRLMWDVEDV